MQRISRLLPQIRTRSLAAAPSVSGADRRALPTTQALASSPISARQRTGGSAPLQPPRAGIHGLRNFLSWSSSGGDDDKNVEQCLAKYVNIGFVKQLVAKARDSLQYRDPNKQPSDAGLALIAAYTSAGLDRHLAEFHARVRRDPRFNEDMLLFEKTIGDTIKLLKKGEAKVVRRNVQLDRDTVASFAPGSVVGFDRLTSVTIKPQQTYRGGNVDFVIETRAGVVQVEPLSDYDKAEREGILDLGAVFEVVKVETGREDGIPSQHQDEYPAVTIHLREKAAVEAESRRVRTAFASFNLRTGRSFR
ncbi:MAG: hypothetical protein JF606_03230 [Burkholderiales bacterium]|nr:hypothetical protein [Burkholderiales bacterium]